jgi:hypothetical protein
MALAHIPFEAPGHTAAMPVFPLMVALPLADFPHSCLANKRNGPGPRGRGRCTLCGIRKTILRSAKLGD